MKIASWFLPTPKNNYRARLLSNTALCVYVILLVVGNIAFGNVSVVRSTAALNEIDLIKLHNEQRAKQGLSGLSFNSQLAESARQKGVAMLESDCWSHYCPDGKSPWDFFRNVDYVYSFAGENLAEGFNNNEAVMRAWMNSKTHRENILKSEFTEVGIALVSGLYQGRQNNTVIVVHFGKPKPVSIALAPTAPTNNAGGVSDSGIKILSPKEGEVVGSSNPQITGEVSAQVGELRYQLKVSSDENNELDSTSGRIIPQGGLFTIATDSLTDGNARVDITPTNSSGTSGQSVSREFKIDTAPPVIALGQITLQKTVAAPDGPAISTFQLTPTEQIAAAEIVAKSTQTGSQVFAMNQLEEGKWSVDISEPGKLTEVSLHLTDLAGNSSSSPLALEQVIASSTVQTAGVSVSSGVNWLQIFGIILVSFLLGLFIIDHVRMRKLKEKFQLPQIERSHLHIPTLSILLLILVMGNFTGMI